MYLATRIPLRKLLVRVYSGGNALLPIYICIEQFNTELLVQYTPVSNNTDLKKKFFFQLVF